VVVGAVVVVVVDEVVVVVASVVVVALAVVDGASVVEADLPSPPLQAATTAVVARVSAMARRVGVLRRVM
jgi:hypothetical protein